MTIFSQGRAISEAAFEYSAEPISIYRDGNLIAGQLLAKVSNYRFRTENSYGVTIVLTQTDFTVRAEEFPQTPKTGDIIRYNNGEYLVSAPNEEPCWRWHIPGRQKRIHAKYLDDIAEDGQ